MTAVQDAPAAVAGKTVWQMQDCGWWLRERVVELGEEFGPAGPAVANWLECQAKLQDQAGVVKSGYRAIARNVFLPGGAEEAERIVLFAVEIGFLKDFTTASRTFTARISAFQADQTRGRAAARQAARRAAPDDVAEPKTAPMSRSVTDCHALREEESKEDVGAGGGERAPEQPVGLHPQLDEVLGVLRAAPGLEVEPLSVNAALTARGDVDAIAAAQMVASWAHEGGLRYPAANRLLLSASRRLADEHARTAGVRDGAARREQQRGNNGHHDSGRRELVGAAAGGGGARPRRYTRSDDA